MFGKLSSKTCATLLFVIGLICSLAMAYLLASVLSWQTVWVAVERSIDALPTQPVLQQNTALMTGIGAVVFLAGVILSFLAAELYYFMLEFFKKGISKVG